MNKARFEESSMRNLSGRVAVLTGAKITINEGLTAK